MAYQGLLTGNEELEWLLSDSEKMGQQTIGEQSHQKECIERY
jgi:hypothetical protein